MQTNNIRFCIMNNYHDYPEVISSDVDIAIGKNTFKQLDILISTFAKNETLTIVQKIWNGFQQCAYILAPRHANVRFRLQLDFITDYGAPGYPLLLRNEEILEGRIPFKSFSIPAPEIEALLLLMKRIVKNDLKLTHIVTLKALISTADSEIKQMLRKVLGEKLQSITFEIIKSADIMLFTDTLQSYRKSLAEWSQKYTRLSYRLKYRLSTMIRMIHRSRFPVGFSVVFLGPDGSGKSTIAGLVLERVSGSFHGGRIQYWRPYLFPAMGRLKLWNPSEEPAENPNPHDHPQQNVIKSLLRFFYYFLDYIIGYPFKIYLQKVKKEIIIFDRYYYDYLVDLHRYQFNIPQWLPEFLLPLIPAPDLTIYLDAEPETLFERKQELSLPELTRQISSFRTLLPRLPQAYLVNTERPIDEIVRDISSYILEKKAKQTRRIIKN